MDKRKKALEILKKLQSYYPTIKCGLDFQSPFQLLIATILSAQCTDARVNIVTPILFAKYPDANSMAKADLEDLKTIIHSTGFYNNKAKNILATSKLLSEQYGGSVPQSMEELIKLPGVARKTANVVLGVAYKNPVGIAVDTHVRRLSNLLGLTESDDPVIIESDLMKLFDDKVWDYISLALIQYGRDFCTAKKHDTSKCFLGGH